MTFTWSVDFRAALTRAGLSQRSVRAYVQAVERFVRWWEEATGETFSPETLAPDDALRYRQHLIRVQRRRPSTVNQAIVALRRFAGWAEREGHLEGDPTAELKTVRRERRRQPPALSEPEVYALFRAAGLSSRRMARRNYALVQLLVQTGLRVGELVRLRLEDLTVRERSGRVRVRYGKGERDRDLPLNASARRALRLYFEEREAADPAEPAFLGSQGGPLSERAVQKLLARLGQRARIDRVQVTPHTLRHTFAKQYLRDHPGQLVELAHLMGHDSLDTTAVYTQPSWEELAGGLEETRWNVAP